MKFFRGAPVNNSSGSSFGQGEEMRAITIFAENHAVTAPSP
jgi:hypothetical protein